MASFAAYLSVGSTNYRLYSYDLAIRQETDSLGRPSSPTQGGIITCTLDAPNNGFLHQWMFSPTMQADGKLILMQESPESTLKTISFFNAYCVNLDIRFRPGAGGAGSFVNTLRISPQRVAIGAIILDNNWPLASHGAGETFQLASYQRNGAVTTPPKPRKPPICAQVDKATTAPKKEDRYAARMAVIAAARQNPALQAVTDQFELNNRAIERARLSDNIYNLHKKQDLQKQLDEALHYKRVKQIADRLTPLLPYHFGKTDAEIEALKAKIAGYPEDLVPPDGWDVEENSALGEEPVYVIYKSKFEPDAKPVLVFRGTDNAVNAWQDWKTNGLQGMGRESVQYNGSRLIALEMEKQYGADGFEVAGHSKAGGQAAFAGVITGAKTYTFNAAGVHADTLSRKYAEGAGHSKAGGQAAAAGVYAPGQQDISTPEDARRLRSDGKPVVDAFNFPYDVLNHVQDNVLPMPTAIGVRHVVPAVDAQGNPIADPGTWKPWKKFGYDDRTEYHGMSYIIDSMEYQKQQELATMANALGCR